MMVWKMNVRLIALLGLVCCLALATQSAKGQTYTSDSDITHFSSGIVSYATFSHYNGIQGCEGSTFMPTSSELATTRQAPGSLATSIRYRTGTRSAYLRFRSRPQMTRSITHGRGNSI